MPTAAALPARWTHAHSPLRARPALVIAPLPPLTRDRSPPRSTKLFSCCLCFFLCLSFIADRIDAVGAARFRESVRRRRAARSASRAAHCPRGSVQNKLSRALYLVRLRGGRSHRRGLRATGACGHLI